MNPSSVLLVVLACVLPRTSAQSSLPPGERPMTLHALPPVQKTLADTLRPPADFTDVDRQPELITKKEPVYPPIAVRAGMEGKVWVKVWVDKEGRPRDVQVLKSDAQVFNQAAVDAAWGFRFTPAYLKDKPVDVWVTFPFQFRLAPKAGPDSSGTAFPKVILEFVRSVLQGSPSDGEQIERLVYPGAQAIAGGTLVELTSALRDQLNGRESIEHSKRKVTLVTGHMNAKGSEGYLIVRTEGANKKIPPHYHSIVIEQEGGGPWKIMHWHAW